MMHFGDVQRLFSFVWTGTRGTGQLRADVGPVSFGFWQLLATKSGCGLPKTLAFQPASIKIILVKTV
jgi:hypothetical protein